MGSDVESDVLNFICHIIYIWSFQNISWIKSGIV